MATPGWYPDPAGRPGAYRFWDGQAWGSDVTDNPFGGSQATTPGPVAPANPFDPMDAPTAPPGSQSEQTSVTPTYQSYDRGYGQQPDPRQGWAPTPSQSSWAGQPFPGGPGTPGAPGSGSGGSGGADKVVGLILLALVLTVALGVGTFFVVRSATGGDDKNAGDDTTSQVDPTSDPTEDPADDPTQQSSEDPNQEPSPATGDEPVDPFTDPATPTAEQCTAGRPAEGATGAIGNQLAGGGLTMPEVSRFGDGPEQGAAFTFADGVTSTSRVIEQVGDTGWVAIYMVGGITRSNGFDSPGQAAGIILECMTGSDTFYNKLTGATLLDSRLTTVDGAPAWVMDAEIRVDDPQLTVEGDIAKVVVVDTGDPQRYGLFISLVPIGDDALIAQQEAQAGLLKLGR